MKFLKFQRQLTANKGLKTSFLLHEINIFDEKPRTCFTRSVLYRKGTQKLAFIARKLVLLTNERPGANLWNPKISMGKTNLPLSDVLT